MAHWNFKFKPANILSRNGLETENFITSWQSNEQMSTIQKLLGFFSKYSYYRDYACEKQTTGPAMLGTTSKTYREFADRIIVTNWTMEAI